MSTSHTFGLMMAFALIAALGVVPGTAGAAGAPSGLRCEYMVNPLGIETQRPRLSWQLTDSRRGARQTAHQVLVGDAGSNKPNLWDSGKIASDQSVHVPYGGKALSSMQRVWWRVRIW